MSKHSYLCLKRKTKTEGLKAHQASEGNREGRSSLSPKDCISISEIFLTPVEALKEAEEKSRAVINDAIIVAALVSVTMNGQQRSALSISARVQKCTLADMSRHKENREKLLKV